MLWSYISQMALLGLSPSQSLSRNLSLLDKEAEDLTDYLKGQSWKWCMEVALIKTRHVPSKKLWVGIGTAVSLWVWDEERESVRTSALTLHPGPYTPRDNENKTTNSPGSANTPRAKVAFLLGFPLAPYLHLNLGLGIAYHLFSSVPLRWDENIWVVFSNYSCFQLEWWLRNPVSLCSGNVSEKNIFHCLGFFRDTLFMWFSGAQVPKINYLFGAGNY